MQGKIIKGIAGFYYVYTAESEIYECKAKGIFRKEKVKPLVGDDVEINILDPAKGIGNICKILPRKNVLLRPAVANVDQALVFFAMAKPNPNLNLLDRFLVSMERREVPVVICFNKRDIAGAGKEAELREIYQGCGRQLYFVSVQKKEGTDLLMEALQGRTTVVAGPSGAGKSSFINLMYPGAAMETGEVSRKIDRGKHTTRHSELFSLGGDTYLLDSPGFTSLYLQDMEEVELKDYFTEFREYEQYCRFQGCVHKNEPDCAIKQALAEGKISPVRYKNYIELYEELKSKRRY